MKQAPPNNHYELMRQGQDRVADTKLKQKLPDGYDARQARALLNPSETHTIASDVCREPHPTLSIVDMDPFANVLDKGILSQKVPKEETP